MQERILYGRKHYCKTRSCSMRPNRKVLLGKGFLNRIGNRRHEIPKLTRQTTMTRDLGLNQGSSRSRFRWILPTYKKIDEEDKKHHDRERKLDVARPKNNKTCAWSSHHEKVLSSALSGRGFFNPCRKDLTTSNVNVLDGTLSRGELARRQPRWGVLGHGRASQATNIAGISLWDYTNSAKNNSASVDWASSGSCRAM